MPAKQLQPDNQQQQIDTPPLPGPISDDDLGVLYLEDRDEAETQDALTRWGDVAAEDTQIDSDQDGELTDIPEDDDEEGAGIGEATRATGRFVRDIPLQTIGAFRDAAQGLIDTGRGVDDLLSSMGVPSFVLQYSNEQGEIDFDIMTRTEAEKRGGFHTSLPEIPGGASPASVPYRKLVQFLVPFSRISKGFQATRAGTTLAAKKGGKAAVDIAAGVATDLVFWEAQEARLSDLVESTKGTEHDLSNPVTEYLATDEDDPIIIDKIKVALEGAGLGGFFHTLLSGLKSVRKFRKAKQGAVQKAAEVADEDATEAARSSDQLTKTLGNVDSPAVKFEPISPEDIAKAAEDELGATGAIYNLDDEAIAVLAKATKAAKGKKVKVPKNVGGRPVVNFATFNGPEDVESVLKVMTNRFRDTAAKARGPVVTHAETEAMAKQLGIKELLTVDPSRMNRAEIYALKDLYMQSGAKLLDVADIATQAPTAANLYAFRKMMAIHEVLLGRFVGAGAEAGRTLNALRIPAGGGSREQLKMLQDMLTEKGGTDVALELARKVARLKGAAPEVMAEVVKRGAGAKTLDAVQEAWVQGLVSGPASQARNVLSNAAFMFESIYERSVAARLPGATVEKGEAAAFAFGAMQSLRQSFVNSGKAFWNNTSGYGIGKVDLPFRKAISSESFGLQSHGMAGRMADFMGGFYRLFGRALNAGDEFFKTQNYNGELWALAMRKSKQEGLQGEELYRAVTQRAMNPDESMRIAGRYAAQRGTFTLELGKAGKRWQSLTHDMPALRFITPFVRTPGNIFKEGFVRSPFAALMPKSFWGEIAKGGAAKDLALAKVATGSAVMALFSDLTSRGVVTGRGPLDPTERQRLRETGWQPYSINPAMLFGDDNGTWFNYRSIEPIGMMLGMAADGTELMHQYGQLEGSDRPEDQEKLDRIAASAIAAMGNSVTSTTFMRGVSDFFTMMSNPEMYAGRWVRNYASTVIPRLSKAAEREVDPTLRETYTMMDKIADQVPWWGSTRLHPLRDLYGNPIELSGAWGPDWISPIYTSKEDATPMARAIVDIGIRIRKPGYHTSFALSGEGAASVNLRSLPAVYDHYQVLAGHELKHPTWGLGFEALANKIVEGKHELSDIWDRLPDSDINGVADKGEFLRGLANEYRELARRQIMEESLDAALKPTGKLTELDLQFLKLRDELKQRIDFKREANIEALGGF